MGEAVADRTVALSTLVSRVVDDGRELVHAEIALAKTKLVARVTGAGKGLAMIFVALLIAQAALTTLLMGFALGLAPWVGFLGGGAIAAVVAFALAGLLVKLGIGQITGGSATPEIEAAKP